MARVHVVLDDDSLQEFKTIPKRLRSLIIRRLLNKYFEFQSKSPSNALAAILTGRFKIEVIEDEIKRP